MDAIISSITTRVLDFIYIGKEMRLKIIVLFLLCMFTLQSCKQDNYIISVTDFNKIERDLTEKFGLYSYYTDLSIVYNENIGHVINVVVTDEPESLQMKGWVKTDDDWKNVSEVSLELKKGRIEDYMFTLNEEVSMDMIENLVNTSIREIREKEEAETPVLGSVSITSPNDGDKSKMGYTIEIKSEIGKTFDFFYNLEGDLIEQWN
ncbi:hypothetical protein [Aquimarina algiphila]|uniref:hypothetical protein n=1 Tax=Aquimarina algiphila TaxID=2047982 RepID=UPI00232A9E3D|nr:hypothetical protein [Aquimarina algiphila]